MIKVLVADDEKIIREGIGRYIKGMDGFVLCGVFENGEKAFQGIMEEHPDLIISDVLMPKCDGIELIKRCRQQNITCEFIIISGYSEFEYAKAAIKYGVLEYINKPIDPEILFKSMEKAKRIIEDKNYVKKELQYHFYDDAVEDNLRREPEASRYIDWKELTHRVVLFNLLDLGNGKTEFCEEVLRKHLEKEYISYEKNGLVTLIAVGEDAEFENCEYVSKEIIEKGRKKGGRIFVGLGDAVGDMKGIPVSYKNALAALRHGQANRSNICFYEMLSYQCRDSKKIFYREYLNMERYINARDAKKIVSYAQTVCKDYQNKFPPYIFYDFLFKCCELLKRGLDEISDDRKISGEFITGINTAVDSNGAAEVFAGFVNVYCESLMVSSAVSKGETIDDILEYIQLKYMEELSIERICKLFFINESYFSSLFKNKMSCNYNEYVTDLRVNKSKELLASGKYKINEVADMVGYHSSRYFSKVFKNKTGMLPQEYRNQYIFKD